MTATSSGRSLAAATTEAHAEVAEEVGAEMGSPGPGTSETAITEEVAEEVNRGNPDIDGDLVSTRLATEPEAVNAEIGRSRGRNASKSTGSRYYGSRCQIS